MTTDTKTNDKKPLDIMFKSKNSFSSMPKTGEIAEGQILEKRGGRIYIDLGLKGTGLIYGKEYYEAQELLRGLKSGDTITAKIVDPDNEEGYVELSVKEAGREKNWDDMRKIMETGESLTLKISEVNRGGLVLEYKGVKGFMPVSQLSSKNYPRVPGGDKEKIHEELRKFLNRELTVKIIDVNPAEEKLIFSEKSNESAEIQQKLSKFKVGDVIEGEITGLTNFGAFVTFDEGLEGLIHISEIDWQLIENPADVLKINEKIKAKIIGMEKDKVALSLKTLKEDPWLKVADKYKKGEIVKGVVVKYNPFGAFVKLDEEIQGLLHISEFGNEARMKEEIALNQEYELKILSVDPKEHRLGLGFPQNHPERAAEEIKEGNAPATPEEKQKELTEEKKEETK
ncbi:MAG: hypothetical protein A3G49_03550 [Candidatus Sungbacteria bacterium RIFCSPLOWO2_12_FULL_41_11]|uniref:S1 motif domain-containing protein n=1 Tax=Candidatus Sungbacteria bacterium RIFCSPLOWO2_12_FULL_41_11 TaxID=1802286 RepID=A0A1G2LT03_9BACT|nr:MAG: hypothetical protein A3D41_03990 [Candidatus Sungbacteria bacterium RIFCSPHIGHO2_02_FULL_41_12b]OHA14775.1 MAG: hypothetical protein A3G49_03550 [Candidatus Sungbacteria bacterium RIFCSPLOWO2_12_FULL_41_11]